jgi:hypothetical protein
MLNSTQWAEEIQKLDQLIGLLESAPPSPESAIAEEHVQSARSCAWGAMPDECEADLKFARTAIGGIGDTATRRSAQEILSSLPTTRSAPRR